MLSRCAGGESKVALGATAAARTTESSSIYPMKYRVDGGFWFAEPCGWQSKVFDTASGSAVSGNSCSRFQVDERLEYLENLKKLLQNSKENNVDKGADELEAMRAQLESFDALKNVVASRRKPDPQLGKQPVKSAVTGQTGRRDEEEDKRKPLKFDYLSDDDEVLLRLFAELDQDKSGTIESTELLRSVGDGMIFSARESCRYEGCDGVAAY